MSNENDETRPIPPEGSDDWLLPGTPHQEYAAEGTTARDATGEGGRLRRLLKPAALVVAGLVAGGGLVAAAQAVAGDDASDRVAGAGGAFDPRGGIGGNDGYGFDGHGAPPGFGGRSGTGGGPGGLDGEQRLTGTLTAVGSSTVTVRSTGGTATYEVTDATQILVDGQVAELADLTKGDQVLVHVYPSTSNSDQLLVERIFAGDLPTDPRLGGPGLPDGSDPDGDDGSTGFSIT